MNGKEFLSFTRKERNGILTLLFILFGITFLPELLFPRNELIVKAGEKDIRELLNSVKESEIHEPRISTHISDNIIEKKRSAAQFTGNRNTPQTNTVHYRQQFRGVVRKREMIEINTADTAAFIDLPGIGSKLASRIVLFREKLGGFINVHQLGEVYGLKDSVLAIILPTLRCDTSFVKKIPLNTADKDVLAAHPYIRWNAANMLVNYRTQHGAFNSINDLAKIHHLDSALIRKMEPYLAYR